MSAVLVMAAGQGFGLTEFKDGATHNIENMHYNSLWVDYQAPGMGTTVNLLVSGSATDVSAFNSSHVIISGGVVDEFLSAFDSSQVTISGGGASRLCAYDSSQITISDGWIVDLAGLNNSQVTISEGVVAFLSAFDSSQVTMSGGFVTELSASYNSQVTMSGGLVCRVAASGNSQITMSGGQMMDYPDGPAGELIAVDSGQITIDGSNFAIDGTPFSFGEIPSILGGSYEDESYRTLTGTLANGDIIDNRFRIGNDASIIIVPEPSTLLLFALGGLALRRKR